LFQISFAYIGDITDRLEISYAFLEDDAREERSWQRINGVGLNPNALQWHHFRYNIEDRLKGEIIHFI